MTTSKSIWTALALTLVVGAGLGVGGCNSSEATATATPASHAKAMEAIQNNPNMPAEAKQQALDRMKQADKEAGFMPGKKG